jgi:hypothetical protein
MQGYYTSGDSNNGVSISNPFVMIGSGSNSWELVLTLNGETVLSDWFTTKKEAVKFLNNWIIKNA